MGRAIAAAAAVSLAAGCVVSLEGAPCSTPGSTGDCPAGQACGNDGKCWEAVAGCVAAGNFCVPGQDTRCAGNQRELCMGGAACGVWEVVEDCGALFCDGPADVCRCADPASDLFVDAGAGGTTPGLAPTGAMTPPECRFPSISTALAAAAPGHTVRVVGAPGVYADLPIRVRKGIALVADDAPLDPAARILENAETAGPGVALEEGARLEGFTVRATPGEARQLGIKVECAGPGAVTLRKVRVDAPGGAILDSGVALTGPCAVALEDAEVYGVTGVGLAVSLGSEAAVVTVTRGVVQGNGTGISLTRGDLRLDGTRVAESQGTGLLAGDGGADTRITAADCLFKGNLDTAVQLNGNLRVDLRRNRLCQNGAVTDRGSALRKVGGLFVRGAPPPSPDDLVFQGNELVGNAADQLFVTGTTTRWDLDGGTDAAACAADRNLFRGYSGSGRGLVTDVPVDARWNAWEGVTPSPPPLGQDYEVVGSGTIDVGASNGSYCDPVPAARGCD